MQSEEWTEMGYMRGMESAKHVRQTCMEKKSLGATQYDVPRWNETERQSTSKHMRGHEKT